jgi:hypothetical protein
MRKGLLLLLLITSVLFTSYAQWVKCNLPAGVYPWSMASSGNYIYLGTLANGMYVSTDKGTSWNEINNGITLKQIWSVSITEDAVYAGTNNGGLFRTTDKGASWTAVNSGIASTTIVRSVVKFNNKLFATTSNQGVLISTDNAATWAQHNNGIPGLVALPLLVADNSLYVGVLQKVYKYDLANSKWIVASAGIVNNTISSLSFFKEPSGTVNLFAGISDPGKNVYRSIDSGSNWTAAYNGLPGVPVSTVAVKGTTIFAGNDYGVYISKDYGNSWTDASNGFPRASYATNLTIGDQDVYVIQSALVWRRSFSEFGITAALDIASTKATEKSLTCFPNPFSDRATISYQLQRSSHVALAIFDLRGALIEQIINDVQPAGSYNYQLLAGRANLLPGTYIVKLTTDKSVQTQKIVLGN